MKLYIGENIKRLRTERNMTQDMLAQQLGVSFQTVSHWETELTYPDVEMIPEIATFFEVTTDELMGVDKAVMERRLIEDWDIVNQMRDPAEQLEKYREMRRKYPKDSNVLHMLITTMADFPELLPEMRKLVDEYLVMPDVIASYSKGIISLLISCETDENVPALLDKYASDYPQSRASLLAQRFNRAGDYETEKKYHQYNFLMESHYLEFVYNRYGGGWKRCLELYNWQTGTEGMSLAVGDGVPDLWYSCRIMCGFRYAEQCVTEGRIDEAYTCLEDIVTLYERFYSQPAGTVLTFRSDVVSELKITLKDGVCSPVLFNDETKVKYKCFFSEEEDFGVDLIRQRDEFRSNYNLFHHYCPQYDLFPLVSKWGWEGFDPIRNDERFIALIERMNKYVIEVNE